MARLRLLLALCLTATLWLPQSPAWAAPFRVTPPYQPPDQGPAGGEAPAQPPGSDAPAPPGPTPGAPAPVPAPPPPRPAQGLRLAVVTDSHWVAGGTNKSTREVLKTIAALAPDLVVHTGDVTEMGHPREYEEYLAAARVLGQAETLYVPGNHDARWLDPGKAFFRKALGPTQRSLDRGGIHLVLLDSSIDAEAHGHLDRATLDWLAADLARVGAERPVLIFLHHPVAYTPLPFADSDDEFLAVLAPYNVRGVFVGHGHLQMRWERNGIPFFMTAAADAGGFKLVDLDTRAGTMTVYNGSTTEPLQAVTQLPLARPAAAPVAPSVRRAVAQAGSLAVEVQIDPGAGALQGTGGLQYLARIDTGPWAVLGPGATPGRLLGRLPLEGLTPGRHRVTVWMAPAAAARPGEALTPEQWVERNTGPSWSAYHDFDLLAGGPAEAAPGASGSEGPGAGASSPVPLWRAQLRGGIQGSPALDAQGNLYAGSRAGEVAAFAPGGKLLWRRELPAPVVGAPALTGDGHLVVADTGGSLYVLATATGSLVWQAGLGAPVVAEPLVAAGQVLAGDAAGVLHALDLQTGTENWRYQAGAAIRSRVTYAAGSLYLGAWDRSVHSVDAFTGARRWVRELPGSVYFSPANQPPLYFRGRVYVTRSQPQGEAGIYALDARTGEVLWSARGGFGYSAPVLHGGQVAVADSRGTVAAFDPMTGRRLWTAATGLETFDGALSSFGGDLVLAGLNGQVAAVRPPAGQSPATALWRYAAGRAYLYARPVLGPGRLYVATMDGSLLALGAAPSPALPLTYGSPGHPASGVAAAAPSFPDTVGHWSAHAVGLGERLGLAGGFPDGTFQPDAPLTRAQLAVLVTRYLGLPAAAPADATPADGTVAAAPHAPTPAPFADLEGHWARTAIEALAAQGLASGLAGPDGRLYYEPDRPVRRAEAAAILTRLLQRPAASPAFAGQLVDLEGHWSAGLVRSLEEIGLVRGISPATGGWSFLPDQPMTRAEATALLVRAALGQ